MKPNFDVQIMYDEITKPKQLDLSDTDSSDDELVVQAPQIDNEIEHAPSNDSVFQSTSADKACHENEELVSNDNAERSDSAHSVVHINSGFFVNQTLISRNMINVHAASNSIHKTLSQNEMDTDRYYQ